MANFWIILLLLTIFTGRNAVTGRPSSTSNRLQEILNQLCHEDTSYIKCYGSSIINSTIRVSTAPPETIDIRDGSDVSSEPSLVSCSSNEKRCPQLLTLCVPNDYDCDKHVPPCQIPQDLLETKTLVCGDGKAQGNVCGNGDGTVPVLTLLLAQCYAGSDINLKPITSLNAVSGPGGKAGAGVYQCSFEGKWVTWKNSPALPELISSCRNDGCGRLPYPSKDMPILRKWAWVRAIYKNNTIHCTATLVSPTAAVTSAHCLTKSIGDDCSDYELELPRPIINGQNTNAVKVILENIYFHPYYSYNDGTPQHDLAVVFFRKRPNTILPTVCITDRYHSRTHGTELVFNLLIEQQKKDQTPNWDSTLATVNPSCNGRNTQFCASHKGMQLSGRSNGEPYLVDVGEGGKEEWVLMGIRSLIPRNDLLAQSIYEQVADDTHWIKNCVFEKNCDIEIKCTEKD